MDRRVIFVLVFFFTLLSTVLVFAVCLITGQTWLATAVYSLAAMWIVGIISQLLMRHLYLSIVKPMDDAAYEDMVKKELRLDANLDEVESINEVIEHKELPKETAKEEEEELVLHGEDKKL